MKKILIAMITLMMCVSLTGCDWFDRQTTLLRSSVEGLPLVVQTYDENANIIDRVEGNSVDFAPDTKFDLVDSDGAVVEKSSVLNIIVGGKSMMHVGSSLICYDSALVDVFDEYQKTLSINNVDNSVPIVNRVVNNIKNDLDPTAKVILIRSQNGTPLATFVGNEVSYQSTSIDKSTYFLVDGHSLFIYRCDYTVYELDLLQ